MSVSISELLSARFPRTEPSLCYVCPSCRTAHSHYLSTNNNKITTSSHRFNNSSILAIPCTTTQSQGLHTLPKGSSHIRAPFITLQKVKVTRNRTLFYIMCTNK